MLCGFEYVHRPSIYREQPFRKPDKRWLLYMGHCINCFILCDTFSCHWFFHIVLFRVCYVLCVFLVLFLCLVFFYLTTPIHTENHTNDDAHAWVSAKFVFTCVLYIDVHAIDSVGLCCVVCDMICFFHAVFSCFVLYVEFIRFVLVLFSLWCVICFVCCFACWFCVVCVWIFFFISFYTYIYIHIDMVHTHI